MIMFTKDTACYIAKSLANKSDLLYEKLVFDDGLKTCQVIAATQITEDFECNGMTMSVPVGYRFSLDGGNELNVSLSDKSVDLIVAPETQIPEGNSNEPPGSINGWIAAGVHKYHF